jgi:hypothetical protein
MAEQGRNDSLTVRLKLDEKVLPHGFDGEGGD